MQSFGQPTESYVDYVCSEGLQLDDFADNNMYILMEVGEGELS